jgi:hypothetical protein
MCGWMLESLHSSGSELGGTIVWGAIALGSGFWWLGQQSRKPLNPEHATATPLDRATIEKTLTEVEALVKQLETEVETSSSTTENGLHIPAFKNRLAQLNLELNRNQIRLALMGGKAVGKTTLVHLLSSQFATQSNEIQAIAEIALPISDNLPELTGDPNLASQISATDGSNADVVLFVIAGDLTDSEFQTIQQLLTRQQRVILVFNKQDQYLPADRLVVLQQLRQRLEDYLAAEDVVAITTNPAPLKVRQHQADGLVQERVEHPQPDVALLTERLSHILTTQKQQFILNTIQRQLSTLKVEIQVELNQIRRDRALSIIEQSQWIAAAAAFANPVPSLDLLATAAITTQLVTDLGEIYQQKFSLEREKAIASTLASQMVKLGLVEMTSQAVVHLLKSTALTYVAGGLLQAVSAAYLTRLAGLSLVEYFQEQSYITTPTSESPFQIDYLTQKLKAVFQENQRTAFLQTLFKQGINRFLGSELSLPRLSTSVSTST